MNKADWQNKNKNNGVTKHITFLIHPPPTTICCHGWKMDQRERERLNEGAQVQFGPYL